MSDGRRRSSSNNDGGAKRESGFKFNPFKNPIKWSSQTKWAGVFAAVLLTLIAITVASVQTYRKKKQAKLSALLKATESLVKEKQYMTDNQLAGRELTLGATGPSTWTPTDRTAVVWTLCNRGPSPTEVPPEVIKSMATLFENAQAPSLVSLYIVYFTADSKCAAKHTTHQCPLLKSYRDYCTAHALVCRTDNIHCVHQPFSQWFGRYPSRYFALKHFFTDNSVNVTVRFLMWMDERHLMVKRWDTTLQLQWHRVVDTELALNHASGFVPSNDKSVTVAPSAVILTCTAPDMRLTQVEMARNYDQKRNMIMAEQQRHADATGGATSTEPRINQPVSSYTHPFGLDGAKPMNALAAAAAVVGTKWSAVFPSLIAPNQSRYTKSYQFALDAPEILPGTWTCPSHWCPERAMPIAQPTPRFMIKHIIDTGGASAPIKTCWYDSRLAFGELSVFKSIPDDPRLIHCKLADGIDFIQSTRFWGHGVSLYNPTCLVAISQRRIVNTDISQGYPVVLLPGSTLNLCRRYLRQAFVPTPSSMSSAPPTMKWGMFGTKRSLGHWMRFAGVKWKVTSQQASDNIAFSEYAARGIVYHDVAHEMEADVLVKYDSWHDYETANNAIVSRPCWINKINPDDIQRCESVEMATLEWLGIGGGILA